MAEMAHRPRCYFLGIPPELRLTIYEYVYAEKLERQVLPRRRWVIDGRTCCHLRLHIYALLKTCRVINNEATAVLYNSVMFAFLFRGGTKSLRYLEQDKVSLQSLRHVRLLLEGSVRDMAGHVMSIVKLLADNQVLETCVVGVAFIFRPGTFRRELKRMLELQASETLLELRTGSASKLV
ncbi:hypothetical protein LTR37_005969 [Vermiconidia calcicola]|uniref:Uncharacterized protein n=1 Tax=Vermiconidia calcicola TaxID=1690605 RepID=A0ACC3NHQ6_9PEZI|nr:hypothetical protein LTR37_005969 [Vermiconidia calcicola]